MAHVHVHPHTCKIPCISKRSPVPTSLLTVLSHMPNRNFIVITATLVIITFCFHNSALSCFVLNEAFNILQQLQTLHFGYTNYGSQVPFQIFKNNSSCRQGYMCRSMLLHQLALVMDCTSKQNWIQFPSNS